MATKEVHHRSLAGFIATYGGTPLEPECTVDPAITGTATEGETLTADVGTWTGREPPVTSIEWLADDVPIEDATGETFDLTAAEVGTVVTVSVTGKNWAGTVVAVSAATATVGAA